MSALCRGKSGTVERSGKGAKQLERALVGFLLGMWCSTPGELPGAPSAPPVAVESGWLIIAPQRVKRDRLEGGTA